MAAAYQDWGSRAPVLDSTDTILDLDALDGLHRPRRGVRFGGANYDLALPEDLSALDHLNLARAFERIWAIEHDPGDTDGQVDALQAATLARLDRRVCEIALYAEAGNEGVPLDAGVKAALVAGMTAAQRNVVRNAFFSASDGIGRWVAPLVRAEARELAETWLRALATREATTSPSGTTSADGSGPRTLASSPTSTDSTAAPAPSRRRSRSARAAG